MKKKLNGVAVLLILFVMVFMGCSGGQSTDAGVSNSADESAAVTNEQYHMVFIVKTMQSPFMLRMIEGAQTAAADLNIKMDCLGPETPFSTEEQIRLMENAISQGVDAIIIAPSDSNAIIPGIKKANEAGIIVATPNTKAYGGEVLTWTGVENYDVGYQLGKKLAESLNGKGKVVLLEGIPGSSTSTDRIDGYNAVLAEYPGIEVIASQTANFNCRGACSLINPFRPGKAV